MILHADKDGFLLVEYRHAQGSPGGRVYSRGIGYQACTKETRAFCSARFYVEDDIVNAFPAIMKQVFNQLGLRTPFLDRYVEDRDGVFEELSSGSLDRRRIKELFIMCLHGGDYFEKAGVYLHFLHRFRCEIRSAMQVLLRNPRFAEINTLSLANVENPLGRAIALICQRNERKIMQAKTEFERCHLRATDLFDGHLREIGDLDLEACSTFVASVTGFAVKFALKPAADTRHPWCDTSLSVTSAATSTASSTVLAPTAVVSPSV